MAPHAMTDEELRERLDDIVTELRELRRLVVHPSSQERAERLFRAMATHVEPDDHRVFEPEDVIEAAREDFELSCALGALGLESAGQLGYWLRGKAGRAVAGFVVTRNGRGWRMELCR